MNTLKIVIPIIIVAFLAGCKPDKKAELAKLKKQHAELAEKIKILEASLSDSVKVDNIKYLRVSVEEIKPTVFKHFIEVQGKLDGEESVDVQPEGAGGTVTSVLVKPGQAVTRGQALARLNDAALREQLRSLESTYHLVKENFDRTQRLWDQKIGSEIQYIKAKSDKESLEAQIGALQEQINMSVIKSPINGTVEEVNIKIGQIASPQLPVPAFRVINFNSVKVKAEVADAYSNRIQTGDNVIVYFPDLNREVTAKISSASRYISPMNRTFTVEVAINPEKNGFKANMVAVLKINDYKSDNAIVVPVNYIQSDLTGNFVYIAHFNGKNNVAKKAYVEQGQSYNGFIEINKGLADGDKVITSGYLDIEDGGAIKY
jgi:membrane fusion protein, multidrug efflux system